MAKAITLFEEDYPWGEAVQVARENHCAVHWSLSRTGVAPTQEIVERRSDDGDWFDWYGTGGRGSGAEPLRASPKPPGARGKGQFAGAQLAPRGGKKGDGKKRGNQSKKEYTCRAFQTKAGCSARKSKYCPEGGAPRV